MESMNNKQLLWDLLEEEMNSLLSDLNKLAQKGRYEHHNINYNYEQYNQFLNEYENLADRLLRYIEEYTNLEKYLSTVIFDRSTEKVKADIRWHICRYRDSRRTSKVCKNDKNISQRSADSRRYRLKSPLIIGNYVNNSTHDYIGLTESPMDLIDGLSSMKYVADVSYEYVFDFIDKIERRLVNIERYVKNDNDSVDYPRIVFFNSSMRSRFNECREQIKVCKENYCNSINVVMECISRLSTVEEFDIYYKWFVAHYVDGVSLDDMIKNNKLQYNRQYLSKYFNKMKDKLNSILSTMDEPVMCKGIKTVQLFA